MALARFITSGLRSSGQKGPDTSALRAAANSAIAFFCASVSLSAGIGGMRSCAVAGIASPRTVTTIAKYLRIMAPPKQRATQWRPSPNRDRVAEQQSLAQMLAHKLGH